LSRRLGSVPAQSGVFNLTNLPAPTATLSSGAASLPLELARTKPYSYSLFDVDVLSGICQSLSNREDNLWRFKGPNGAGVGDAVAFLFPSIATKSKWPYAKDVEYFDDLPSRRPSLLFAGEALGRPQYYRPLASARCQPHRTRGHSQPAHPATSALG
jgi:hypothetical protein